MVLSKSNKLVSNEGRQFIANGQEMFLPFILGVLPILFFMSFIIYSANYFSVLSGYSFVQLDRLRV